MNSKIATLAGVMVLILQFWIPTMEAAQGREQRIIVGKTGVVTFTSVTNVGSLTLQPGRYLLQHRVDRSGEHAVHFVMFGPMFKGGVSPSQRFEQKCKLEPLQNKATRTRVFLIEEDGGKRVTRIDIKGENVAHVF
jgi:hypothetical protein